MSVMNRQWPLTAARYHVGAAAGVSQELALGGFPSNRVQLLRATYFPSTAMVVTGGNSRTLNILNKGVGGVGNVNVATTGVLANATYPAFVGINIPITLANSMIAAGEVLTIQEAPAGTGVASPPGHIVIEYILT